MRKTFALVAPLSCALAAAVACSSNKPAPVAPTTTPDAGPVAVDGAAPPPVTAAPAADAGAPAPVYPTFFTSDAGASAPPAMTDQALDQVIDVGVAAVAAKAAPKMDKEGQPGRATLKEGEHFGMVVTLQPNRCYTFIGFSPPGAVAQLDLKLYAMPLNVEAGKSSPGDKAAPVMGKGTAAICPLLPVAVPYKLDAVATKGQGRMGVWVYARNK
jgi:hypothetical protein